MPLACLAAVAGGVSSGPAVRAGFAVSSLYTDLGQRARRRVVPGSWHMGVAETDSADTPTGILRLASRWRWLAVVESGGGLAGRSAAARQPGAAVGRGAAFSAARRTTGQVDVCAPGLAGG